MQKDNTYGSMPRGSDQQQLTSLIILKKSDCSSKDNGL
jgi:hypothetical protein